MGIYDSKKITMSSRVNVKAVATLVRWFKAQGVYPPERGQQSWLINYSIETLAHSAIKNGHVAPVGSHEEALKVLAENGVHFPKESKPGKEIRLDIVEAVDKEQSGKDSDVFASVVDNLRDKGIDVPDTVTNREELEAFLEKEQQRETDKKGRDGVIGAVPNGD